jgi:hypothetical protein
MTTETARILVAAGFFMMLVLLRLDAERFGAAEYDEPAAGKRRGLPTWLAWYAIGLVLLYAIYVVHPRPHDQLYMLIGHWWPVMAWGTVLAVLGSAEAFAYAQYRYGGLRLPPLRAYPRAAFDAVGTALVDEAMFRAIVLGGLVSLGTPVVWAIAASTILYILIARLAAPGRPRYLMAPAVGYGVLGGVATLATGGIGAAIFGHAFTRFIFFVCTGHAGHAEPVGREPEELAAARMAPEGWRDVRQPQESGGDEPLGLPALAAGEPRPERENPVEAIRLRVADLRHYLAEVASRGLPDGRRH